MFTPTTQLDTHFAVLLPTYKRPDSVVRSIESVINQTYSAWHLYVVIDDNTTEYSSVTRRYENHSNITFVQNAQNIGKNASLNTILNALESGHYRGHVLYLDDDDWLAPTCLSDFNDSITKTATPSWLVSFRTNSQTNIPFTNIPNDRELFNYNKDVLLLRKFSGDATHCVYFPATQLCRFPTHIKNAEEWIYFAQVSNITQFTALKKTGTYSEGYAPEGLTHNHHNNFTTYSNIVREVFQKKICSVYVFTYLLGRLVKVTIQSLFRNRNKIRA